MSAIFIKELKREELKIIEITAPVAPERIELSLSSSTCRHFHRDFICGLKMEIKNKFLHRMERWALTTVYRICGAIETDRRKLSSIQEGTKGTQIT